MQSLVNAIRATGSTNVIMVPGVQYTNTLTQWLANKPADPSNNLAASWHSYANQICNNQSCWDSVIKPVLAKRAVDCRGDRARATVRTSTSIRSWRIWTQRRPLSCLGMGHIRLLQFSALISAYDGTPTGFGAGVRDHFLALSGQTPAASPPVVPFFSNAYPFGIAVGSTSPSRRPMEPFIMPTSPMRR